MADMAQQLIDKLGLPAIQALRDGTAAVVPVEASADMLKAGNNSFEHDYDVCVDEDDVAKCYTAMLTAGRVDVQEH